jgi:hypothetical protein
LLCQPQASHPAIMLLLSWHHHSGDLQLQASRASYFRLGEYEANTTHLPRGVERPSLASTALPKTEGAGNAGCLAHPQPRVQCRKHTR